nr:MAG TPA: hypothetical protein [Caudoviricetes sp.]
MGRGHGCALLNVKKIKVRDKYFCKYPLLLFIF